MLYLSPPCTIFSPLQELFNKHKTAPEVWDRKWDEGVLHVDYATQCAKKQLARRARFMFEHPQRATSWRDVKSLRALCKTPGVQAVDFDMCSVGLVSPSGQAMRKRTRIITNCKHLADKLQLCQCPRDHIHQPIDGSDQGHSLSRWAQCYPPALVRILAESAACHQR